MSSIVLAAEGAFTWLSLLPFLHSAEGAKWVPMAHSALAVVIILGLAAMARLSLMRLPSGRDALIPDGTLTTKNFFELYIEAIMSLCRGALGHQAEKFFPLIGAVFLYIFVSNVLGLFPGFLPPTDQLNTNIPIALVIFVVYNVSGIKEQGFVSYMKHFMGPVLWLAPLMFVIEIISHLVRPASLSVRLYGNIFGDHMVLDIFLNQLPNQLGAVLGFGIPVIFLGLGLFVCFIQAFVFSLLSVLYIGLAVSHDH